MGIRQMLTNDRCVDTICITKYPKVNSDPQERFMQHKMTFDIFCLKLAEKYPLIPCSGYTAGRWLKGIRLPGPNTAMPDRHYLYLLSWETYKDVLNLYGMCSVLLYGMPEETALPEGNIVAVFEVNEAKQLINFAFDIFAAFMEWNETLHEAYEKKFSPEQMFDAVAGYMQMEIAIANQKNNFDYITLKEGDNDPMGIYELSPDEFSAVLNTQKEFPESFRSHSVQLHPSMYHGLMYYYNFFLDEEYLARLLGIFPDGPFASGQLRLFRYVSVYAEQLYILHYKNRQRRHKSRQFILTLQQLLQAKKIQPQLLHTILDSYNWKSGHTFQVLKLNQENMAKNEDALNFLCSVIEEQFPSCCALQIEKELYCIRNISLEDDPQSFHTGFSVFLRENLCTVGISNEQKGILSLPILAEEAKDALHYGLRRQPTLWSFHFSDYVLDYLKDAMTAKYNPTELVHSAFNILKQYDQEHGTCLTETLRVFTDQRFSASAAAGAMYIHRSTFLHRLKRIQELTDLDFDRKKDRVWLTLSFFMDDAK